MDATEPVAHRRARRRRRASPGWCCRPKRAGTRTRRTGDSSCARGRGVRRARRRHGWSRPRRCCPTPANNAWISMVLVTADCIAAAALRPGSSMPASMRATRTRPDELARCDAGRRRRLRPARLHADAAIAPAAAGEAARQPEPHARYRPATSTRWSRARPSAIGFRPQRTARRNLPLRSGSRIVVRRSTPSRWSATAAPRAISARCLPIAPIRRWPWSMPIVRSETGPLLIDAVAVAGSVSGRA